MKKNSIRYPSTFLKLSFHIFHLFVWSVFGDIYYVWIFILDHRMIGSFICLIFELNFSLWVIRDFQESNVYLGLRCFFFLLTTFFKNYEYSIPQEKKWTKPIYTIVAGKQKGTAPACGTFPHALLTAPFLPTHGNSIMTFMIITSMSFLIFLFLYIFNLTDFFWHSFTFTESTESSHTLCTHTHSFPCYNTLHSCSTFVTRDERIFTIIN